MRAAGDGEGLLMDALLFMFKLSLTEGAALRFCRPCIPNALNAGEGIVVPVWSCCPSKG